MSTFRALLVYVASLLLPCVDCNATITREKLDPEEFIHYYAKTTPVKGQLHIATNELKRAVVSPYKTWSFATPITDGNLTGSTLLVFNKERKLHTALVYEESDRLVVKWICDDVLVVQAWPGRGQVEIVEIIDVNKGIPIYRGAYRHIVREGN